MKQADFERVKELMKLLAEMVLVKKEFKDNNRLVLTRKWPDSSIESLLDFDTLPRGEVTRFFDAIEGHTRNNLQRLGVELGE